MRLRRYPDRILNQDMLLCVVIEETMEETVVVTVFKTSQLGRYGREVQP
jgi:ribosomal protein S17